MKITKLILDNFAGIYTALSKTHIEIDLTNVNERIIMLVGPNGSGKTTILSTLHPFAYNKMDENRPQQSMILDKKNGYKEIHYKCDGDEYIIQHFYKYQNGKRSVKSFIQKNGQELNENGNTTSFLEIIAQELEVDQNYFTLLRLGPNVQNLIDKSYGERKNFVSSLLSKVKAYLKFYAKVSDKLKAKNTLLKSTISKIIELRVRDEESIKIELDELEEQYEIAVISSNKLLSEIGELNGKIDYLSKECDYDKIQEILLEIKSLNKSIEELNSNKLIKKYNSDIDNLMKLKKSYDKKLSSYEKEESSIRGMIETNQLILSNFYNQNEDKNNTIKYLSSDKNKDDIISSIEELEKRKSEIDNTKKDFRYSKDDLLKLLSISQEIDNLIDDIKGFDKNAVKDTIVRRRLGKTSESYAETNIKILNEKILGAEFRIQNILNKPKDGEVYIMFQPPTCENDKCPYIQFYEDYNTSDETLVDKIKKQIHDYNIKKEYYENMIKVDKKISFINLILKSNSNLISKVNYEYYSLSYILSHCNVESDIFYDEEVINNDIRILESIEDYDSICNTINEFKKELEYITKNDDSIQLIQSEIIQIQENIENTNNLLENSQKSLAECQHNIEETTNICNELNILIEDVIKINDLITNKNELQNIVDTSNESLEKISQLQKEKSIKNNDFSRINEKINTLSNKIDDKRYILRQFNTLTREKNILEEEFEKIKIIKQAVSSQKGIPLIFQKLYFKDCRILMNKFLKYVYDDLQIEEFEINETEFRIPYNKKGMVIDDVSAASQGEQAFITIALSFALMLQSLDAKYNIPLLDEIDGALDDKARNGFLEVLEEQLENIRAEQVFIISHNGIFDLVKTHTIFTGEI